jgi:hypothetical protein
VESRDFVDVENILKVEDAENRDRELGDAPMIALELREKLRFEGNVVSLAVGPAGELVVATSRSEPTVTYASREESPGFASFPDSRAPQDYALEIRMIGADRPVVRAAHFELAYPTLQPLPNGDLLAVGARSRWRDGKGEHNAVILEPNGDTAGTFCAGDGIQSAQVSPTGAIWISYFDEGVFGNFGWGADGTPTPLGAPGLVRWSLSGEKEWEYRPPEGFGGIDDCYAMNLDGETVWICYYSDFPIVRIERDGIAKGWPSVASGAHALAVASGRVALVGGYGGLHDRVVVGDLERATRATYRLCLPDGKDVPASATVLARGSTVHAVLENHWFVADLARIE